MAPTASSARETVKCPACGELAVWRTGGSSMCASLATGERHGEGGDYYDCSNGHLVFVGTTYHGMTETVHAPRVLE